MDHLPSQVILKSGFYYLQASLRFRINVVQVLMMEFAQKQALEPIRNDHCSLSCYHMLQTILIEKSILFVHELMCLKAVTQFLIEDFNLEQRYYVLFSMFLLYLALEMLVFLSTTDLAIEVNVMNILRTSAKPQIIVR
jgi:hypothetical protein